MFKQTLFATATFFALAAPALADCNSEIDALAKAISGPVTMADGHRAAMMRMALSSYDHCMAGDAKSSAGIRDMIMNEIAKSLGGNR